MVCACRGDSREVEHQITAASHDQRSSLLVNPDFDLICRMILVSFYQAGKGDDTAVSRMAHHECGSWSAL
jgi:hypothetical protein